MNNEPVIRAVRVAVVYAALAAVWALCSRVLTVWAFPAGPRHENLELFANLAFSGATAALLFWLIRREMKANAAAVEARRQSEEALRASEAFKEAILNSMHAHIAVLGADGTILEVNEPWKRFATENPRADGIVAQQVAVGANYLDICRRSSGEHAEGAMEACEGICAVLSGRLKTFSLEYPCNAPGEERWFLMAVTPFRDVPHTVVVSHTEITTRKRAEEAAREGEARLNFALEATRTGAWDLSLDDYSAYRTLTHARIFGYDSTQKEWSYQIFLSHVLPEERPLVEQNIREALERQSALGFECRIRRVDGEVRWIRVTGGIRLPAGTKPGRMSGIVQDITERKRAEEAVRENEQKFSQIFNFSPTALSLSTMDDGRFVDVNAAYLKMFQRSRDEVVGHTVHELNLWADPTQRDLLFSQLAERGEVRDFEMHLRLKSGQIIPVFWSGALVTIGGVRCLLGSALDMTERKRAEEALRESKQLVEGIMNALPVRIFWKDRNLIYLGCNEAFARDAGFESPKDIIGKNDFQMGWREQAVRYRRDDQQVIEQGRPKLLIEEPQTTPDGRTIALLSSKLPLRDAKGEISGLLGTYMDITERKRTEEALKESLLFRHEAEKIARIGAWKVNPRTDYLYWTEGVYAILEAPLDYKPGLAEGLKFYDAESIPALREALMQALDHGTPFTLEVGLTTMTGRHLWTEVRGLRRLDEGESAYVMGTFQDITERKRAEEDRLRHATVIEQAAEAIVVTDERGLIQYVNPAFERISGYRSDEVLGKNPRLLKSGRQTDAFYRGMWDTLGRGEVWNGHFVNRRKDGAIFEEEATISPVRNADGKVVSYVAIKRDVTEQEQMRHQLFHAQKMETIGQLAGGVAHDFNNLLQAILGYNEILLGKTLETDHRRGDLLEIQKTGRRAAELTRQLLALGRKQNLDERVTDVNALIEDLSKMLRRVLGEDIHIDFDLDPCLARALVDHGQIGQILLNLAVNARDAMPRGGRLTFKTGERAFSAAELTAQPDLEPGSFVFIAVADTGTGIPAEIIDRIFEPFFTTKGPGKGTGLGLATSYGIARQHGGWMDVTSDGRQGACFTIYLPAIKPAADVLELRSAQVVRERPITELRGRGQRILLVEDEAVIRIMIERQLTLNGYVVISVPDAAAARAEFERAEGRFDLVLTDVVLPDSNGLELLSALCAIQPGLRVLISSGYTDNDKRWPLIRERKWPFIAKPYTSAELLAALHDVFATP